MVLSPSHSPLVSPKCSKSPKFRFETTLSLTTNEPIFTGFIQTIKTISINNIPKLHNGNCEFGELDEEYAQFLSINLK